LGKGLSWVRPKIEPFSSNCITFFQIQEVSNLIFKLDSIPCTHRTFFHAKYYEYKILEQIKIRVYLSIELNNELKLIFNYKFQSIINLFFKSQIFYIHILALAPKTFLHGYGFGSKPSKTFFHGLVLLSIPTK